MMSVREKLLVLFIQTCRTEQARQDLIKNDRKISAKTGNKKKKKKKEQKKNPLNGALK